MVQKYNKDTEQKILAVGNELFMEQGYYATSTRQIAKAAGITQPNLYHYFKDKETLYVAVIEKLLTEVGEDLSGILQQHLDFQQSLEAMADYLMTTHYFDLNRMLQDLAKYITPVTRYQIFSLWKENYRQPFEDLFQRYGHEMRSQISPELAARHFFFVLSPYITQKEQAIDEGLSSQTIVDLFLHGIIES